MRGLFLFMAFAGCLHVGVVRVDAQTVTREKDNDGVLRIRVADLLFIQLTEATLDWLVPRDDGPLRSWEQIRLFLGSWIATPRELTLEIRAKANDQGNQITEITHELRNAVLTRQTQIHGLGKVEYEMKILVVHVSVNNQMKPPRAQVRVNVTLDLSGATLIRYSFSHDELLGIRLREARDWSIESYVRGRK